MNLSCPACGATNRVPEERLSDQPVCGKCGHGLMEPTPVALDQATFQRFIANTDLPVLVDFWAEWCGPCKMMAPRFAKVDTEAAPQLSAAFNIRSIPTLALFKGGKEVARVSGAMSAADLQRWVLAQG